VKSMNFLCACSPDVRLLPDHELRESCLVVQEQVGVRAVFYDGKELQRFASYVGDIIGTGKVRPVNCSYFGRILDLVSGRTTPQWDPWVDEALGLKDGLGTSSIIVLDRRRLLCICETLLHTGTAPEARDVGKHIQEGDVVTAALGQLQIKLQRFNPRRHNLVRLATIVLPTPDRRQQHAANT